MTSNARSLVIGNWKMNLDFVEALHLGQQIGVILKNRPAEHTDIVVVPPFVDLRSVTSIVDSERIAVEVGAQHVNPNDNGAFTGEISTNMLKRLNVTWVLVGTPNAVRCFTWTTTSSRPPCAPSCRAA